MCSADLKKLFRQKEKKKKKAHQKPNKKRSQALCINQLSMQTSMN